MLLIQEIMHGAYVINLDDLLMGTHWVAIYVKNDVEAYFDSFGVEFISNEFKKFIGNKIVNANIDNDSIMCRHFCIVSVCINFTLNNNLTNLCFPTNF